MTLWDSLLGRSSGSQTSGETLPPSSSSSFSNDNSFSTTSSTADASFSDGSTSTSFGTLADSYSGFDPAKLHPLAGLGNPNLDYLSLEDTPLANGPAAQTALPSRGFTDDIGYGTGITYVTALSAGGAWGLVEGWNKTPQQAPPRLKLNAVLNSITRRGPFLGNSAAILAMTYNLINPMLGYVSKRSESLNNILSGALAGMLFKSTKGARPMLISGGIMATVAGAWTATRRIFSI